MKKLSYPQYKFCELYVSGYTPIDAYCDAYNVKEENRQTAHSRASALLKTQTIQERINLLRAQLNDDYRVSREDIAKFLMKAIAADFNDPHIAAAYTDRVETRSSGLTIKHTISKTEAIKQLIQMYGLEVSPLEAEPPRRLTIDEARQLYQSLEDQY